MTADTKPEQTMIFVNGKCFYCDCGCNVFTKLPLMKYKCNSCSTIYHAE